MTMLSRLAALSGLNRVPHAKQSVKDFVYWLQDPFNHGVRLSLGGTEVKVPARFARAPWTHYEPAATRRVAHWLENKPNPAVVDVGCSIALYSLLALSLSPDNEVWAIDSDLVSLQSSRWLCSYVGADRLRVICGYVGDAPTVDLAAPQAADATAASLADDSVPAEPSLGSYICLNTSATNTIPVHRIDRLFAHAERSRPWLMKIDVEGAELHVLRGAEGFIGRARPQLLVSVHPPALRAYGLAPDDVKTWLTARDYAIEVDLEAHEEHWWCSPAS